MLRERLRVYRREVEALVGHYEEAGVAIHRLDASCTPEHMWENALAVLSPRASGGVVVSTRAWDQATTGTLVSGT